MTKRRGARYKIDRRLGENIWGHPKSSVVKRPYRPGQGGASRRRGKLSDYATQLNAKQKFRAFYGLSERKMVRVAREAARKKGDTAQNIVQMLESRLQSVVYWAKMAPTLHAARQLISHGHVTVNGRRVKSPGYVLGEGDVVSLTDRAREFNFVVEASQISYRDTPEYMSVQDSGRSVCYARLPTIADVPYAARMEPSLLVEFYSR